MRISKRIANLSGGASANANNLGDLKTFDDYMRAFNDTQTTQNNARLTKLYKKASVKFHPDKNTSSNSTERFTKLSTRYAELLEKYKRARNTTKRNGTNNTFTNKRYGTNNTLTNNILRFTGQKRQNNSGKKLKGDPNKINFKYVYADDDSIIADLEAIDINIGNMMWVNDGVTLEAVYAKLTDELHVKIAKSPKHDNRYALKKLELDSMYQITKSNLRAHKLYYADNNSKK